MFGIIHSRIIIPKQKERCQTFMPESVLFLRDFFHSPFDVSDYLQMITADALEIFLQ